MQRRGTDQALRLECDGEEAPTLTRPLACREPIAAAACLGR